MKGCLSMSVKERRELVFFDRVAHKQLTLQQASEALGLSYRQDQPFVSALLC